MNTVEAHKLRAKACGRKRPMGRGAAIRVAETIRAREGGQVSPYRCPFCGEWHVGHVPSIETVARIAAAIRCLAGNNPKESTR